MTADDGLVYELHFDEPIGDPENPKGWAQHYIGHTTDLDRRMGEHRRGSDAAIMRAVGEAGIGWHLVRTWPGTRDTERQIKLLRSGRRLCPECTEHPLTGAGAVARAAALRQHREAQAARGQQQEARLETRRAEMAREREAARAADPYEDGRRMARQWLARQDEAGRTADQIEAVHEYVTGPWHEMGHHTEDQAERHRGYTELVRAALAEFREYEAAAEPVPQHEMEAETGPAGPAGDELEERMQENEAGSWLARDGDGQVLEVDAGGHPGQGASPDDGRPVAEAAAEVEYDPAEAEAEAENADMGGDPGSVFGSRGVPDPGERFSEWHAAREADREAEAC